ncbi:hypothetical protein D6C76_05855 [Aureobasidium pullulans]|nr:hypothetical protein D6C76_05855 [Aureobasidium pullulans]
MSNRLCSGTEGDGNPSRGSCTDESWESGNCPQYCLNDLKDVAIYDCNARQNLKNSDGQPLFCCYQGNSQNCCTTGPLFTAEALRFTSSTSSTTSASSTAQSSATTATSSSSASVTTSAKPSATQEKAASSGTDHTGIGIGVGIGVAVPLLLIAVAGFLFWRRRRRHGHHSVSSGSSPSPDPNQRPAIPMPGAYSGDMDRRTAEARAYELESMRKPAELPGSEIDKKDFDNYQPRFLRPSSVDKLD